MEVAKASKRARLEKVERRGRFFGALWKKRLRVRRALEKKQEKRFDKKFAKMRCCRQEKEGKLERTTLIESRSSSLNRQNVYSLLGRQRREN